jgi:hypothetical protein
MRQIALLSQDQAFQQQIAFLCEAGGTPRSQNSFTNLTEQLSPPDFQPRYNLILRELYENGAFTPLIFPFDTVVQYWRGFPLGVSCNRI